jgi:hypothetical protein
MGDVVYLNRPKAVTEPASPADFDFANAGWWHPSLPAAIEQAQRLGFSSDDLLVVHFERLETGHRWPVLHFQLSTGETAAIDELGYVPKERFN